MRYDFALASELNNCGIVKGSASYAFWIYVIQYGIRRLSFPTTFS